MQAIKYNPEVEKRLRNVSSLPRGNGCRFMVCIQGLGDDLIAKRWARCVPGNLQAQEIVIDFFREQV